MEAPTLPIKAFSLLIVDDEPLMTDLFRQYMTRIGYHVSVAACGSEALDILSEKHCPVKIIVTDMSMPGMSGIDLALKIRLIDPEMQVIITTGVDTEVDLASLSPNIAFVLQKPYQNRILAEKIEKILTK